MSNSTRWHNGMRSGAAIATLLLTVNAAGAGMAELGRKKNLADPSPSPEASGDTAAGNGWIDLIVGNETFTRTPGLGETVSTVLATLATQINGQSPQRYSASVSGAVITVVRYPSGTDVSQFGMVNSDSGFGFVEASHSSGALFLLAVCETPAGNGTVQVIRNGSTVATVSTAGLSAEQVNEAVRSQVGGTLVGTCSASLDSPQRRRIVVSGTSTTLSWEDNDTGITDIGVRNNQGGGSIPTLSEWGLILMMAALAGAALLYLRRRPAPLTP